MDKTWKNNKGDNPSETFQICKCKPFCVRWNDYLIEGLILLKIDSTKSRPKYNAMNILKLLGKDVKGPINDEDNQRFKMMMLMKIVKMKAITGLT